MGGGARNLIVVTLTLACGGGSSGPQTVGGILLERSALGPSTSGPYAVVGGFSQMTSLPPLFTTDEAITSPVLMHGFDSLSLGPCIFYSASGGDSQLSGVFVPNGPISGQATPSGVSFTFTDTVLEEPLAPGDTVTFTSDATAVTPAFSIAVVLPGPLSITNPNVVLPFTIPRSSDFTVTHSTDSPGRFIVQINQDAPLPTASLVCLFPADQPSATVPATALAQLAADSVGTTNAYFGVVNRATTQAGDVMIDADVDDYVRSGAIIVQ